VRGPRVRTAALVVAMTAVVLASAAILAVTASHLLCR
jgi:hypothetical protein